MNRLRTSTLRMLLMTIIGLMSVADQTAGLMAQESGSIEPIVVLDESGIEVAIIGSTTVHLDPAEGAHVTLERITVAEGATFGPLTPASPELFVLDEGALQQQDARGFWSRMDAPYQMVAASGEQVAWTAASDSTLLRLRLTDATPEDVAFDGVAVERVAQFRLEAVPAEPARVFIAEASLSGRVDGALLDHDGLVGIAVVSGAIDVLSPSGLEGRLGAGQSALYPNGAPLEFLGTADDEPARALLFGVSTTDRTLEGGDAGTNSDIAAGVVPQTANRGATSDELAAMLPAADALPITGLDSTEDSSLTEQEVIGALGSPSDAETRLEAWGWSGNATRSYVAPEPSVLDPTATTNITISMHGFGSDQAAAEALPYFSDVLVNVGYQELDAGEIGSTRRLFAQPQEDGGALVALYVQQEHIIYRIGGYSPAGDPTDDVIHVAEHVLRR